MNYILFCQLYIFTPLAIVYLAINAVKYHRKYGGYFFYVVTVSVMLFVIMMDILGYKLVNWKP